MMKRKRILKAAGLALALLCLFPFILPASAEETEDPVAGEMEEQLEASGADGLYDLLPEQTQEILKDMGVTMPDINQLNQISPLGVFQSLADVIGGMAVNPLRVGVLIAGILFLSAMLGSLFDGGGRQREIFTLCISAFLIVVLIPPVWNCLSAACSAIVAVCDFSLVYVPILTALAASSGSVSASAAYNAMVLGLAQVMSQFSKRFLMPCAGIFIGLGVAGSVSKVFDFSQITQAVRKAVTVCLAFCGTVFTALITTRGAVAHGVDTLALKGAKFVVGSFVPVIGGSVSDAVGSIMSGLSVVKSSVGIFSIIAVALILAPIVIELLLWMLCLHLCAGLAGALGEDGSGKLLRGIADGLSLINTVLIFCLILFIVSTAVILTIRAEF